MNIMLKKDFFSQNWECHKTSHLDLEHLTFHWLKAHHSPSIPYKINYVPIFLLLSAINFS